MFTISVDDHQAAAELEKAAVSFTLVDPKEYFHHCVGALRAAVNPGLSFIVTMNIECVLKNIKTTKKTNKQRLFLIRVHGKDSNPIPGSVWRPVCPRLHPVPGRGEPESSS